MGKPYPVSLALVISHPRRLSQPRAPHQPINEGSRQPSPARRPRMDQSSDPLPSRQADEPAAAWAAVVVQNGRLSGARKTLTAPITTIGRAESCDLRLNAESVHPVHCVLAFGPTGLALRNLQANNGTLVNGQAVTTRTLHDGEPL